MKCEKSAAGPSSIIRMLLALVNPHIFIKTSNLRNSIDELGEDF